MLCVAVFSDSRLRVNCLFVFLCLVVNVSQVSDRGEFSNQMTVSTTAMAKLGGSSGGVTIERTKLNLSQKVQTAEPKLSNDGGGGDIGNKIFNGGGGDGDDGDDDDYFNFEDGDGDGDDGFWRTAVSFQHHGSLLQSPRLSN